LSIEGIISKIKQDAEATAQQILEKYRQQAKKLLDEFEAYKAQKLAEAEEKAKVELERTKQRQIDHAKSVAAKKILAKKRELLDRLYQLVRKKIEELPKNKYKKLFAELIAKLGVESGKILVSADEKVFDKDFADMVAKAVSEASSENAKFEVERIEGNFRGLYLDCGKVRYDLTVDAIMESLRERTESTVVKKLFGE